MERCIVNKTQGLILFELLIIMLLVTLLCTLSYPRWQYTLAHIRMTAVADRITRIVVWSRILATERGQVVILCGSSDHQQCDGLWSAGQLVLIHHKIWRDYPALPDYYRLIWKSSFNRDQALQFNPSGGVAQQGSFYICGPGKSPLAKRLVMNLSGRLREASDMRYSVCAHPETTS